MYKVEGLVAERADHIRAAVTEETRARRLVRGCLAAVHGGIRQLQRHLDIRIRCLSGHLLDPVRTVLTEPQHADVRVRRNRLGRIFSMLNRSAHPVIQLPRQLRPLGRLGEQRHTLGALRQRLADRWHRVVQHRLAEERGNEGINGRVLTRQARTARRLYDK